MSKTIAVTGATGTQGGSVARTLLQTGWKVRAITRDPSKEASKKLASEGCEVVAADLNDEASLTKAFENVNAIFAVTNIWEHLLTGSSQAQSGEKEKTQGIALAQAAATVPTLEHYVWHTLPSAEKLTQGKCPVPHLDYKAEVDEYIRTELPELAKKTSYLFVGFYPQNFAAFPMLKPMKVLGSEKYIWLSPSDPKAVIPLAGDVTVNTGIFVRQILANPQVSKTKYALVQYRSESFQGLTDLLAKVTGKSIVYQEITLDRAEELWGVLGKELGQQLKFGELFPDWAGSEYKDRMIGVDALGLKTEDLKSNVEALTPVKDMLLG